MSIREIPDSTSHNSIIIYLVFYCVYLVEMEAEIEADFKDISPAKTAGLINSSLMNYLLAMIYQS